MVSRRSSTPWLAARRRDGSSRQRTTARIVRRVVVTRAPDQAGELISALRAVGLEPVLVPTIAVELKPGGGELDRAARHLWSYQWVILTSTNGARALLRAAERVFTPFEATRFAAIGAATRRVLEREGFEVDFVPRRSTAAALAAELPVESPASGCSWSGAILPPTDWRSRCAPGERRSTT